MRIVMTAEAQKQFSGTKKNTCRGIITSLIPSRKLIRVQRDNIKCILTYGPEWWKANNNDLTDKQIKNWRTILLIIYGPLAELFTVGDIHIYKDLLEELANERPIKKTLRISSFLHKVIKRNDPDVVKKPIKELGGIKKYEESHGK